MSGTRTRRRRIWQMLGFLAVLVLALVAAWSGVAVSRPGPEPPEDRRITRFEAEVSITANGAVEVRETITYDFGSSPGPGLTRILPASGNIHGYGWRDFGLTDVEASSLDGDLPVEMTASDAETRIRIGDFRWRRAALTGEHRFEISYTYERLLTDTGEQVEYHANIIGTQWELPIERTVVRIDAPELAFTPFAPGRRLMVTAWCHAGDRGSRDDCDRADTGGLLPEDLPLAYAHGRLEPGQAMTVRVAFPGPSIMTASPDRPGEAVTRDPEPEPDEPIKPLAFVYMASFMGAFILLLVVVSSFDSERSQGRGGSYGGGGGYGGAGGGGGGGGGGGAGGGGGGGGGG